MIGEQHGWLAVMTLTLGVGVVGVRAAPVLQHRAGDEAAEVAFLTHAGTADSLATASLLVHLIETRGAADRKPDSTALIERAVALAPRRPELLWLLLRDCEIRRCDGEAQIADRLHAVDPDNGLALLSTLNAAWAGPPVDATHLIAQVGASNTLTLYWNKSLVMMFDAMTHGEKARPATAITQDADDRLSHAAGILAAVDIPPFKPITALCSSEQFQEPGRREACEHLMIRLDGADSIIAQSLSVSVQLKWWNAGSPEFNALQRRRLQLQYLVQASGRARGEQVNQDAERRVAAMRQLATEEAVADAMLLTFNEPLQRPADWQAPGPT